MNSVEHKMAESDAAYTSPIAKLCCRVGIVVMVFGLFILLSWVNLNFAHKWSINFAWICFIALMIYYFFINVKIAAVSTVIMFFFTLIATLVGGHQPSGFGMTLFLIFFFGGIAAILIGHYVIDKKQGLLMSNFQECLVTPMFVIVEGLQMSGFGDTFGVTNKKSSGCCHSETEHMHDHNDDDHDQNHESK